VTKIDPKPAPPAPHDQFEMVAEGHGRYVIDVSLPAKTQAGAKLPVVLVLDGNTHFDVVQAIVNGLQAEVMSGLGLGFMPPSIVVGVGYPRSEGFLKTLVRRGFDFHDPWDMEDTLGRLQRETIKAMAKARGEPELEMRAGGYEGFMAFLRDDLLPALAEHYPVDLKARHTLIGHSSGGLFTLRALFDPKSAFSRYVSISAGGGELGAIERAEAAYAQTHTDLLADVFVCAGSAEIEGIQGATTRFASIMARTAELFTLRQWPSGRLVWEIMNNEDHNSIMPRSVAAALRSVHGTRPGVGVAMQAARLTPPPT
jgi:predicted alpha/beta superfamily hydrolase